METSIERQLHEALWVQQSLVRHVHGLEARLVECNRLRECENRQTASAITHTREAEAERDRVLHANIIEISDLEGFIDCPFAEEVTNSRSPMPASCQHPKNKRGCGLKKGRDVIPSHCPHRRADTLIRLQKGGR